jgi:hypothetical protein
MTKVEALARIDAELARLRNLTPAERAELNRVLANAHRLQTAQDLTRKVLDR